MSTIAFRKTVFFGKTVQGLDSTAAATLVTDGGEMTQRKLYATEPDVAATAALLRTYELYIDYNPESTTTDEDLITVSKIAKVTTDASKTYADGYDLYMSAEPVKGGLISDSGALTVTVLKTGVTVDVRTVYIGEVL